MKKFNISLLAGDGTGPEVVNEAVKILENTQSDYGISFNFTENDLGAERYIKTHTERYSFSLKKIGEF